MRLPMNRRRFLRLFYIFLFLTVIPVVLHAQRSNGGDPLSLRIAGSINALFLPAPDVWVLMAEDNSREAGVPERMGISIPADFNILNSGEWLTSENGTRVWHLKLTAEGAIGLGLYFSHYQLEPGARLYVYSADKSHIIGAFTDANNAPGGLFATEVVKGDCIIIEYSGPAGSRERPPFEISSVLYVYRPMLFPGDARNTQGAGSCQVNTACPEGNEYRDEIRSVVRILIRNGLASYWCTGTIMNNSASDYTPYLLTADHCARSGNGNYSSPADVAQWIFYFLYESPECGGGTVLPNKTLTGAVKVASSTLTGNDGSDFYLLRLNDNIPPAYEPYYSGWDISGQLVSSGVSIHHPAGDVKKISTYTKPLTNSQWGSSPGTHFRVGWSQTVSGHGTTEGGSSGSPLLNSRGKVIGTLTGGESSCSNLTGFDFYGKLAYSWTSNGSDDTMRLKPWLDPLNTGLVELNGSYNALQVVARFKADTSVITVGSSIGFTDLSIGNPNSWRWEFEGGEPASSNTANPGTVSYNRLGVYTVKLFVTNEYSADSLIREEYIHVVPEVFPNPSVSELFVYLGMESADPVTIHIYNSLGQIMFQRTGWQVGNRFEHIDCSAWPAGLYVVEVRNVVHSYTRKFLKTSR